MTREEVKQELERQEDVVAGYSLVSIEADDVEAYADEDFRDRFAKLNERQQERLLSLMMEEVIEYMEENIGFGEMFRNAMDCLDEEDRREEIFATAEKEAE